MKEKTENSTWRVEYRQKDENDKVVDSAVCFFDDLPAACAHARQVSGLNIQAGGHYRSTKPTIDIDVVDANARLYRMLQGKAA